MSDEKVLLGHISGAHGLKGEVKITTFTGVPEDIASYGALTDANGTQQFHVAAIRNVKGNSVIAVLAGIHDRDAAESLRGIDLYVARTCLPAPDADEFYYSDLIGLNAISPDGATIGKIVAVHNFGAGDLLEVRFAGERQPQLIPFDAKHVPRVDIAAHEVIVLRPVYEGGSTDEP